MISQKFLITNPVGLHLRPARVFSAEMMKFDCDITVVYKNQRVNAKSILNVMAACIPCGAEIILECSGSDEEQALQRAEELIENDFEE